MEKIIDTAVLIDQLRILLWDRSKTREELAELVIGLVEEAGEEIVRCGDCKALKIASCFMMLQGMRNSFVALAHGAELDARGEMVGLKRNPDENDDAFRRRVFEASVKHLASNPCENEETQNEQ